MHPPIAISAVLFDLDDTLNDRALSWDAFVPRFQKEYVERLGNCEAAHIRNAIANADRGGYRDKAEFFEEIARALLWLTRPTAEELELFWRSCFADCMVERAGARALLMDLRAKGIRIGIVTNGRSDMQTAKIARLTLDHLAQVVIISDAVGIKKPDPGIFRMALESLGCDAASALFVGDHPVLDVGGAHAAGMSSAWLSLGRKWPEGTIPPSYTISDLADLRAILGCKTTET